MDSSLIEQIGGLLAPILTEKQLGLFDIERSGGVLKVTLDRVEGVVTVGDCAEVSTFLAAALEVDDPIPGKYRLEVSSPGLDRPLRSLEEFVRFCGRLCRVLLTNAEGTRQVVIGRIVRAENGEVVLTLDNGDEQVIDYETVIKARLEVEF